MTSPVPINELPQFGLVYQFWIGDYYYTGSTKQILQRRIQNHRTASGSNPNQKVYKHIAGAGGWDSVKVNVVESGIPADDLVKREQSYIDVSDPFCLNTWNAEAPRLPVSRKTSRTPEIQSYHKAYYESRKEELKQRRREQYAAAKIDPEKLARHREVCRAAQTRYKDKKRALGTKATD